MWILHITVEPAITRLSYNTAEYLQKTRRVLELVVLLGNGRVDPATLLLPLKQLLLSSELDLARQWTKGNNFAPFVNDALPPPYPIN